MTIEKRLMDMMVDRFLTWELPKGFVPDGGISFKPLYPSGLNESGNKRWPIGTNLLTADQARDMLERVVSVGVFDEIRKAEKILAELQTKAASLEDKLVEAAEDEPTPPAEASKEEFPPSKWQCYLLGMGKTGITFTPREGNHPNWFWRKMQYLILGNEWFKT